jgi:soluble lytic murein transglycosylase
MFASSREVRLAISRAAFASITAQSESGNRNYYKGGAPVVSPAGAKYAMQVMPATARDPGFGVTPARSDSPEEFNRVGREYLSKLHERYDGNLAKMWAAYNWGPGNVDRYGDDWQRHAPKETLDYVARNLRAVGGR